jgi:hypothetical protein
LDDTNRGHFEARGYLRVPGAFAPSEAEAMRDVVWRALERQGFRRDDPSTWLNESPSNLQSLKGDDVFKAIGSDRTLAAIDDVIGTGRWMQPSDWGAYFLLFPTRRAWNVPWKAWHLDHDYAAPLSPIDGLKVHSMFGDVAPRAGGMTIVAGSHHVVARHSPSIHPDREQGPSSCASSSCTATTISGSWAPTASPAPGSLGSSSATRTWAASRCASSS